MGGYKFRPIFSYDSDLLYEQRNNPALSPFLRQQGVLSLETHQQWMASDERKQRFLMILKGLNPCGVIGIPYPMQANEAELSIYFFDSYLCSDFDELDLMRALSCMEPVKRAMLKENCYYFIVYITCFEHDHQRIAFGKNLGFNSHGVEFYYTKQGKEIRCISYYKAFQLKRSNNGLNVLVARLADKHWQTAMLKAYRPGLDKEMIATRNGGQDVSRHYRLRCNGGRA